MSVTYLQRIHKVCSPDLSPATVSADKAQSLLPEKAEVKPYGEQIKPRFFFLLPHQSTLVAVGISERNKTLGVQMIYPLRRLGPKPMTKKILDVRHRINLKYAGEILDRISHRNTFMQARPYPTQTSPSTIFGIMFNVSGVKLQYQSVKTFKREYSKCILLRVGKRVQI